jgi:hypothetical protein
MSTTEIVKTPEEIVQDKITVWGAFGKQAHETEIELQLEAQKLKARIITPKNIGEVELAEKTLKEVRAGRKAMEEKRKNNVTGVLDALGKRLIGYEQALDNPILEAELSIIKIKEDHQKEQSRLTNIENEKKSIRERAGIRKTEMEASLRTMIENKVNEQYAKALQDDVKPDDILTHVLHVKGIFTVQDFKCGFPQFATTHISQQEMLNIVTEVFKIDSQALLKEYFSAVDNKFADYHVAYYNKESAIKRSEEETKQNLAQIEEKKENEQIATKLETAAQPLNAPISVPVKELKTGFEIDMPMKEREVCKKVTMAFYANEDKCLKYLRVQDWSKFTPSQMATALCKVKTEDINFQPQGIIFKQISKL